jgi:hypothetical protein
MLNVRAFVRTGILCLAASGLANSPARAQQQPVITPLPVGAVTIQSCSWKARNGAFDADIRVKNHTNLAIAKTRFLLTFIDTYGEVVQGYADMSGNSVSLAPGMPLSGKWTRGVFPLSMKTIACGLVGVKFKGYPNVIFSAVK